MKSLAQRFYEIKTQIGGNRERTRWNQNTGMPQETLARITLPNKEHRRILGQIEFAIKMSAANGGVYDKHISEALDILCAALQADGVLTRATCDTAEGALLPLRDAAKEYDLILAAHAHIDMNWRWGWQETVAATLSTFRTMLRLMNEYPEFTYSQSQASVYKIVEDYDPGMMDEIKARIKEGRWEVTATAWVETDKNMPNTESLLRHIRYTRDYMEQTWGVDPDSLEVDFSPDTFGHSLHIPEINSFGNVKYYYHCRGLTERQVLYRWKAPSGKEVLAYCEPYWYNLGITADIGVGLVELSQLCGGFKTGLVVYGVGDHGGGPTRRDIERAKELMQWPVFPQVKFGTIREFFKKAETVREKLPVWDNEINHIFSGCYTTQSRIKLGNRKNEAALLDAELHNAVSAFATGYKYPEGIMRRAWQNVLLTHFHDILTGSCVQESREHAIGLFADALAAANASRENATRSLSDNIDTSMIAVDADIADSLAEGAGVGYGIENFSGATNHETGGGKVRIFHIFNPSAHERAENVEVTVWDWIGDMKRIAISDHAGNKLPFQLLDRDYTSYWGHQYFRLLIEAKVPAGGYTTVVMHEAELGGEYPFIYNPFPRITREHTPITLENEHLKAFFDSKNGALLSLVDKKTGKEQIKSGSDGGGLALWLCENASNNAWLIGRVLSSEPVVKTTKLTPMRGGAGGPGGPGGLRGIRPIPLGGDLRDGFVMEQEILSSTIRTTVTLDRNAKALAYNFEINWHEYTPRNGHDNVPVLTFSLPLAQSPSAYQTDVAAGAIRRSALYQDVSGLQYGAAVYDGDGRALAIISDCKYGYRGCEDILSNTLINSSNSPDPYPENGVHVINLLVSVDSALPKALQESAADFCHPMSYLHTGSHKGQLAPEGAMLEMAAATSVFSSAGATGDGALLVRVYETCGKADSVTIKLPFEPKKAVLVDLGENVTGVADIQGRNVVFPIRANSIAAIKIYATP